MSTPISLYSIQQGKQTASERWNAARFGALEIKGGAAVTQVGAFPTHGTCW